MKKYSRLWVSILQQQKISINKLLRHFKTDTLCADWIIKITKIIYSYCSYMLTDHILRKEKICKDLMTTILVFRSYQIAQSNSSLFFYSQFWMGMLVMSFFDRVIIIFFTKILHASSLLFVLTLIFSFFDWAFMKIWKWQIRQAWHLLSSCIITFALFNDYIIIGHTNIAIFFEYIRTNSFISLLKFIFWRVSLRYCWSKMHCFSLSNLWSHSILIITAFHVRLMIN